MNPSNRNAHIDLPPPRRRRRASALANLIWILITALALGGGVAGGVWLGKRQGRPLSEPLAGPSGEIPTQHSAQEPRSAASPLVETYLAEARISIAEGGWSRAGQIYRQILEIQPGHPEALASLPLIEKRLQELRDQIAVPSPLPGLAPAPTPESPSQANQGKLELVSEPRGADFRVLKQSSDQPELVQAGKTPASVSKLEAGEYEVQMAVAGWPDYTQKVKVEANRSVSVSAVFARGGINVVSDPPGAEVWVRREDDREFKKKGVTPLTVNDLPMGRHQVELRYENWTPIRRTVEIKGDATQSLQFGWKRSLVTFNSDPEGAAIFQANRRLGSSVTVTPFLIEMPEGDYLFEARYPGLKSVQQSVCLDSTSNEVNFSLPYGTMVIDSQPSGAVVIANGVPMGRTPLKRPVVSPGPYSLEIKLDAHKPTAFSGVVEPGGQLAFSARLVPDTAPAVSRNFTNGVGQQMIWFDKLGGWVAATETTQLVYERIVKANPSAFKDPNRPVDSVNWYDASAFCERLTNVEGGLGNLPAGYHYRLPTDEEWSHFADKPDLASEITGASGSRRETEPVASGLPNNYGLFDIRGNVAEWVQDWYSRQIVNRTREEGGAVREEWVNSERKVLRGGSWLRSTKVDLDIAYRRGARPMQKDANDVGFRVVLMPK